MNRVEFFVVLIRAIMIVKYFLIINTLVLTKTSHDYLNIAGIKLLGFVEIAFNCESHPKVLFFKVDPV